MNGLSFHTGAVVDHLPVMADDRRAVLRLRAGPVWDSEGRLVALEWLSGISDRKTGIPLPAETFFARTSAAEQLRILAWQLEILQQHQVWCRARQLRISLNITRTQAISVLATPSVAMRLNDLRDIVRPELSEYFISLDSGGGNDRLVSAMAELAPLWLDDFGCGTTPYICLTEGRFEAVKVDRNFMERLHLMPGGGNFLKGLSTLVAGTGMEVIAEGIADSELWTFAVSAGVSASQGWMWPEVAVGELSGIAERLPGVTKEQAS